MAAEAPPIDFLIAGVQKGGTTALDGFLRQHPRIAMGAEKELHFFDQAAPFRGPNVDYGPYHARFPPAASGVLRGEATPIYTWWPGALARIWRYHPGMKLIVLLRNPIARAYSHWNMEISRGFDDLDFSTAIRTETKRARAALPGRHRVYSYVDRGFYSDQIRRIRSFFPEEQLLFLKSETLSADVTGSLSKVYRFLGLPPAPISEDVFRREGTYGTPMSPEDRAYLHQLYEYDIRQVERLLGWDCRDWLEP